MKSVIRSLWALLICLVCFCDSMDRARNKLCYKAKTCIHTAREKCGVDGQGNLRRFYDSCDLLEFNCLKGTDYAKTANRNCDDLPPIEDKTEPKAGDINDNNDIQDANENGEVNPEEPGIEGHINVNTDNSAIDGEININTQEFNIDEGEPAIVEEGNDNVEEGAIEGEININTDNSVIEGDITINKEEPAIVEEGNDNVDDGAIEGEININTDNSVIEGEITMNKDEPVIDGIQNSAEPVMEGEINMNDSGIKGEININDGNEEPALEGQINTENEEEVKMNEGEPAIEGQVNVNDSVIEGEVKINKEVLAMEGEEGDITLNHNLRQKLNENKKGKKPTRARKLQSSRRKKIYNFGLGKK